MDVVGYCDVVAGFAFEVDRLRRLFLEFLGLGLRLLRLEMGLRVWVGLRNYI